MADIILRPSAMPRKTVPLHSRLLPRYSYARLRISDGASVAGVRKFVQFYRSRMAISSSASTPRCCLYRSRHLCLGFLVRLLPVSYSLSLHWQWEKFQFSDVGEIVTMGAVTSNARKVECR